MNHKCRMITVALLTLALLAMPSFGCGEESEEEGKRTITIGCLWDFTGPVAPASVEPYRALQDLVRYINQEDPIPGAELELVAWDTKFDSAREIPGYDWVIERGADVIISVMYSSAEILKPFAARDKMPIVTLSMSMPCIEPPGWVFTVQAPPTQEIKAVLEYISDHWPNYPTRPKMGWVGSDVGFSTQLEETVQEYCLANPDKFEWVAASRNQVANVLWSRQVEELKDCDWIGTGLGHTAMSTFVPELRLKSDAKLFSQEYLLSTMGLVVDRMGWEALDGSIACSLQGWWSDPFPIIDLANELLYENHPDEAEEIRHVGVGYVGATVGCSFFLEILRAAVEEVGAENFDGQAFYNTALDFEFTFEGFPKWYYTDTRRYPQDHVEILEIRADEEDAVRVGDWVFIGE